jgi:CheY-like chemotaxis protein/two-component sensor histidine kinase
LVDLESLIVGLVDISKLDAGIVTADHQSFHLNQLLDNMATEYRQLAPQFNIDFSYVSSDIVVNSDSVLLARILRNLLSNAFRYGSQGKVLLGIRRKQKVVTIEVWDNGIGIAKDQFKEIFKEFKRLEGSSNAFSNGLGLGLAIVDKLSHILNHPIDVRSTAGKGSVFSVDVPRGTLDVTTLSQPGYPFVKSASLTNRKIWVIDNDPKICAAMAILLQKWGCEVVTALSNEALELKIDPENSPVDLIIVDYHLNDQLTGLELATNINLLRKKSVPVLMITANYSQSLQLTAKAHQILLINKPIKPMKLKTSIQYLLDNTHVKTC